MASRKSIEVRDDSGQTLLDRYPFRHSLDTGDRGVLVMWAQSRLTESEHYGGPLDGRYDREVTLAVRQYQSDKGLKVTGIIDRRTWECLSGS
ncbi:MAG TPA: peptidoglycan-binding domain-containing protein [Acidimicrobiia bacterium]